MRRRGGGMRVSIPADLCKRGYWEFIKILREVYKKGSRVVNPEIMDGYIRNASKVVPFPGNTIERIRYFRYWIEIAERMGFIEKRRGVRGWILTDKLEYRRNKR